MRTSGTFRRIGAGRPSDGKGRHRTQGARGASQRCLERSRFTAAQHPARRCPPGAAQLAPDVMGAGAGSGTQRVSALYFFWPSERRCAAQAALAGGWRTSPLVAVGPHAARTRFSARRSAVEWFSHAAVKGDGWAGCGDRDKRRRSRAGRQGRGPPPMMPYRARGRSRRLPCRSVRPRARCNTAAP